MGAVDHRPFRAELASCPGTAPRQQAWALHCLMMLPTGPGTGSCHSATAAEKQKKRMGAYGMEKAMDFETIWWRQQQQRVLVCMVVVVAVAIVVIPASQSGLLVDSLATARAWQGQMDLLDSGL